MCRDSLIRVLLVIVIFYFVSADSIGGQNVLEAVPRNATIVLQLESPDEVDEFVDTLMKNVLADGKLEKLICSEPFPLMSEAQFERLKSAIKKGKAAIARIESITVFCTRIVPVPDYSLIIKCHAGHKEDLEDSVGDFCEALEDVVSREDKDRSPSHSDELGEQVERRSSGGGKPDLDVGFYRELVALTIAKPDWQWVENCLVLSSSEEILESTKSRLESINQGAILNDSILTSRRFQRVYQPCQKVKSRVGYLYFDPRPFLPLFYSELDQQQQMMFGLHEIVSGGVVISLLPSDGTDPLIEARCFFPYTNPATGAALIWQTYHPIESIPPLGRDLGWQPRELVIENRDQTGYVKTYQDTYDTVYETGAFRKAFDDAWAHVGGFDVIRHRDNGFNLEMWFTEQDEKDNHVIFRGIASREGALRYRRNMADFLTQDDPQSPVREEVIQGFPAWFLPENVARRRHIQLGGDQDPDQPARKITNSGAVLTDQWMLESDKYIVEQYVANDEPDVPVEKEVGKLCPGARRQILQHRPSCIYIKWAGSRLEQLSNLRYQYLRKSLGANKVVKEFFRLAGEDAEHILIQSESDRVFAVGECVANRVARQMGAEVLMFSAGTSQLEWNWTLFSSRSDESDRD